MKQFCINQTVKKFGINNVRIFGMMHQLEHLMPSLGLGFVSTDGPVIRAEMSLSESRYEVKDGYKITLKSTDSTVGIEHFYQMDFNSLVESGVFNVYVITNDGYMPVYVTVKDLQPVKENCFLNLFTTHPVFQPNFFKLELVG